MNPSSSKFSLEYLEKGYKKYNYKKYVHPDPLIFLYNYQNPADREVVALIAASLAYGRVHQILNCISTVLETIKEPLDYITNYSHKQMKRDFKHFKYRFTTGDQLADFLFCAGEVIKKFGSLENCFNSGISPADPTVQKGLAHFADELTRPLGNQFNSLIPNPKKGSACKRLNLMLRWLVRKDNVDPGGWTKIKKSKLIIPLDTHIYRIAIDRSLTSRKNADMKTAIEITAGFAEFSPKDPVKYDFSLTRPGIGGH